MVDLKMQFFLLAAVLAGVTGCGSGGPQTIATDDGTAAFIEENGHLWSGQEEMVEEEYISPEEMERQALGK